MINNKPSSQIWLEAEENSEQRTIETLNQIYSKKIKTYQESEKIIDMHTHTNYSDGELPPNDLIKYAIEKRIATIGITDHDTLEGIKNLNRNDTLIIDSGISIIDGIELSAKVPKGRMHILGYDVDKYNQALNLKMLQLKDKNINTILSLIEILKKDYGIFFSYNDIKKLVNANHNLGRPDLAKICVKNGYAINSQDAFDKYLIEANEKLGKYKKGLPYEECLELISKSGGIPVLAHPKTLNLSEKELLILIKEMMNYGLQGIEVYHSSHTEAEIKLYLDIANKYDLLISGGSDYHGPFVKPDIELGTGKNNNLYIKTLSLLNQIKR